MPRRQRQTMIELFSVGFLLIVATLIGWSQRFITDDTFIIFRYAKNFADGHGFVYNIGEHVEGYTNFLWTVLMVIPHKLETDPVIFSQVLGILLLGASVVCIYLIARRVFTSKIYILLLPLLCAINVSFASHATNGLGTILQTFEHLLLVLIVMTIYKSPGNRSRWYVSFGIIAASTILTRLDSLLVVAPLVVFLLYHSFTAFRQRFLSNLFMIAVPIVLFVLPWLLWKLSFYGELLPNTYFAKATSAVIIGQSTAYLTAFLMAFMLLPGVVIVVLRVKELWRQQHLRPLLLITVLWLLYVFYVGGDSFEFRILVPIIPILYLLIISSLITINNRTIRFTLIATLLLSPLSYTLSFKDNRHVFAGSITKPQLANALMYEPPANWKLIAETLGVTFEHNPDISCAITAAGVIPYTSNLTTIDLLGLNDYWIARNGVYFSDIPGHRIKSPFSYVLERKVNLFIGYPMALTYSDREVVKKQDFLDSIYVVNATEDDIPQGSMVIELPLDDEYYLNIVYLYQSDAVDAAIKKHNLTTYHLE